MGSNLTFTRLAARRRRAGFGLVEALIAIGVTGLILLALMSITVFSTRSFISFYNYVELDDSNRVAMDTLTRDVREATQVTSCTTNELVLQDPDGFSVTYTFNATAQSLVRVKNSISKTLLTGCESMNFNLGQRNPVGGSYDVYPTATAANAKVVNVSWNCSRTILGKKANTENVQTARIVIRKQGT